MLELTTKKSHKLMTIMHERTPNFILRALKTENGILPFSSFFAYYFSRERPLKSV